MMRWTELRQIGGWLLLGNVLLVVAGAVLRHAAADDGEAAATDQPQVSLPQSPTDPPSLPAAGNPPLKSPTAGADPVLDEIRKLIRDPESGLDVPAIRIPAVDASTPSKVPSTRVEGAVSPGGESGTDQRPNHPGAARGERWSQLLRRADSVHHLASAARELSLEARDLLSAGREDEADALMQQVTQLHAIIGRLTTPH